LSRLRRKRVGVAAHTPPAHGSFGPWHRTHTTETTNKIEARRQKGVFMRHAAASWVAAITFGSVGAGAMADQPPAKEAGLEAQRAPGRLLFAQAGVGPSGLLSAGFGVGWEWRWRRIAAGGEWSGQTVVFFNHWRADAAGGGRQDFWQAGLVPLLRYRFARGRSPWFVEGGIGLAVTDRYYITPSKVFGSRLNFSDNLAVGMNLDPQWRQEVSLRRQHTSNAGIRRPNPGEELLLLRYAVQF